MNKSVICAGIMLGILTGGLVHATTQFRTPLLLNRGVMHYPLPYASDAWWFDMANVDKQDDECNPWNIFGWASGYCRTADRAFLCPGKKCSQLAPTNCDIVDGKNLLNCKKGSLSSLWFGKDAFRAEESFADGILTKDDSLPNGFNPFLAVTRLAPRFEYNEKGAYWGLNAERTFGCSKNWRVGGRISLPFRVIEVDPTFPDCQLQEDLTDLIKDQCLVCNANANADVYDFAYRLDLLSVLQRPNFPQDLSRCLVEYGPLAGNQTTQVGGVLAGADTASQVNSVFLIKRVTGEQPDRELLPLTTGGPKVACAKMLSQVTGQLPADGSGVDNGVYYFGGLSVDYANSLAKDRDAQRTLFVVPEVKETAAPSALEYVQNTRAARSAILQILNGLAGIDSATEFLCRECCIDINRRERVAALGDLYTELYLGYVPSSCLYYVDALASLTFPTGTTFKDARKLYYQTTGNNKHYELGVGTQAGWKPFNWFGLNLYASYNHVFKHNEKKAAPFKGASIYNIGPNIDAKVAWNYIIVRPDITFFHPYNPELGFLIGYELFSKHKDKVEICAKTAVDCLGRTRDLDACILQECTNVMTHKVRGEVFHRWNYFELFAGASQVVAGRNAMQETEAHLGLAIYF